MTDIDLRQRTGIDRIAFEPLLLKEESFESTFYSQSNIALFQSSSFSVCFYPLLDVGLPNSLPFRIATCCPFVPTILFIQLVHLCSGLPLGRVLGGPQFMIFSV